MEKKAVFVDLDGTLLNQNNEISIQTRNAIKKARENGHKIFICTGRATTEVFDNILEVGFDGMICSNGSYIKIAETVIFHEKFTIPILKEFYRFFSANDIVYSIETNNGIFTTQEYINRVKKAFKEHLDTLTSNEERILLENSRDRWLEIFFVENDLLREDVNNLTFIAKNQDAINQLIKVYNHDFEVYQNVVPTLGELSGEISLKGITKGSAIKKAVNHLKMNINDTISIGDGTNDIPMLTQTGVSVAMGNASEEVQAVATFVTDNVEKEGFAQAFKKLNLL